MKIGCLEVPKPTYPSLLWPAEWKMGAPLDFILKPWVKSQSCSQLHICQNWRPLKTEWNQGNSKTVRQNQWLWKSPNFDQSHRWTQYTPSNPVHNVLNAPYVENITFIQINNNLSLWQILGWCIFNSLWHFQCKTPEMVIKEEDLGFRINWSLYSMPNTHSYYMICWFSLTLSLSKKIKCLLQFSSSSEWLLVKEEVEGLSQIWQRSKL